MAGLMREPRTGVMISVEVSWEDQDGILRAVTARMENKSDGGACIRVETPVAIGSKLGIRYRWNQFSGTARYCVLDEGSYLVGIQRETRNTAVSPRGAVRSSDPPVSTAKPQNLQKPRESEPSASASLERQAGKEPIVQPPRLAGDKTESRRSAFDDPPTIEPQTVELSKEKEEENGTKRKHMRRNWFGLVQRTKQNIPGESETGNGDNGNRPLEVASSAGKISVDPAAEDTAGFPIELLSVEDIYRTSGIRNPRKDYGINKVVEMLRSEHVRELPGEMKRAAVLMALDAAGVLVDEVLRDAKARQDALDSYEAERRTQIEAEWARKTKENAQIMAELEGLKLHHMACVNRNLDRIRREQATFGEWLAAKQQESQNISEAAALCLKPRVSKPAPAPAPATSAAEAAAAPAPASSTAEKMPR